MTDTIFKIVKPGLSTSIQDVGRTGFQQFGINVSGAMDAFALQVGNILVGNRRDEAGLEMAIMGPEILVLKDVVIAICGANLSPLLDGAKAPLWKSFLVKSGQTISFGQPISGAYAYLAVSGGLGVPTVMGSKSTYTKANLGGYQGRILQKNDVIQGGIHAVTNNRIPGKILSPECIPDYHSKERIRVVLGPDQRAFKKSSVETLLKGKYTVSRQSDRMGYRLKGSKLGHVSGADILSDAVFPGTIQVPANGEPIVLLADCQTTGGYSRIATVISVDLPYVAQKLPGQEIAFVSISIEKAQNLYVQQEVSLRKLCVSAGNSSRKRRI